MDAALGIPALSGHKVYPFHDNGRTYEYFNGLPIFTQKKPNKNEVT